MTESKAARAAAPEPVSGSAARDGSTLDVGAVQDDASRDDELPLWLRGVTSQTQDADEWLAGELRRRLKESANQPLILSGDLTCLLLRLPHANGVPYALWNLDDDAALGELHALMRDAGAEVQLAHTALCSQDALEAQGIGGTVRAVNERGVRAARSGAAPFVLAELGPAASRVARLFSDASSAEPDEAGEHARRLGALWREQVQILIEAGVHGFFISGMGVGEAVLCVRAVRSLTTRPIVAGVTLQEKDAHVLTADGWELDSACQAFAEAGADALSAEGLTVEDAARLAAPVAQAAGASGLAACARPCLSGSEVAMDSAPEERLFSACARELVACGVGVMGAGSGTGIAATLGLSAGAF